jgi:hypothetical protein
MKATHRPGSVPPARIVALAGANPQSGARAGQTGASGPACELLRNCSTVLAGAEAASTGRSGRAGVRTLCLSSSRRQQRKLCAAKRRHGGPPRPRLPLCRDFSLQRVIEDGRPLFWATAVASTAPCHCCACFIMWIEARSSSSQERNPLTRLANSFPGLLIVFIVIVVPASSVVLSIQKQHERQQQQQQQLWQEQLVESGTCRGAHPQRCGPSRPSSGRRDPAGVVAQWRSQFAAVSGWQHTWEGHCCEIIGSVHRPPTNQPARK